MYKFYLRFTRNSHKKPVHCCQPAACVSGNVLANTHSKMTKKNQQISDNIITTADNDDATAATTLTDTPQQETEQNTARRRHRPTKIPKTADRTLLIPQTVPSKDTSANGVQDPMPTESNGGGGGEGGTAQEEGGKEGDSWTQNQQMVLEWALRHFPKGTDKRWDKIAEQISGKTKVT